MVAVDPNASTVAFHLFLYNCKAHPTAIDSIIADSLVHLKHPLMVLSLDPRAVVFHAKVIGMSDALTKNFDQPVTAFVVVFDRIAD